MKDRQDNEVPYEVSLTLAAIQFCVRLSRDVASVKVARSADKEEQEEEGRAKIIFFTRDFDPLSCTLDHLQCNNDDVS
jgi:hypothetical protein